MALKENLGTFLSLSHFAEPVLVDGAEAVAIFDSAYHAVDMNGVGMASTQPQLLLASASVPANHDGITITLTDRGQTYSVMQSEPDGTGLTRLTLNRLS